MSTVESQTQVSAATLHILTGPHRGNSVTMLRPRFLIGSSDQCHLKLTHPHVNSMHTVLLLDGFTVRVRDMGATIGTKLNGEEVCGTVILQQDDLLEVGHTLMKIDFTQ